MNGAKGISVLIVFCFLIIDGITNTRPKMEETKSTKGTDCQPKSKPIPVINLASPNPIASTFLMFLYKKIINQILKYPTNPPKID